jgi:hypothetical protein
MKQLRLPLYLLESLKRRASICKGLGECQTVRMTHQTVGWVRVAIRRALLIEDVSSGKGS